jgi:hypothetical protein
VGEGALLSYTDTVDTIVGFAGVGDSKTSEGLLGNVVLLNDKVIITKT